MLPVIILGFSLNYWVRSGLSDWLSYLLSETLFNQDQPEKAVQTLEQATAIARELENWGWQIQMLSQIGEIYFRTNAIPEALISFEQALEIAEKVQDRDQQVNILGSISETNAKLGDFSAALVAAQRSLSIAQHDEDAFLLGKANIMLAFAYQDGGEMDAAVQSCLAAMDSFETSGAHAMLEKAKAILAQLE